MLRRFKWFVCRQLGHDWWALSYPPARRWECHRCGLITEEAPSAQPASVPVKRDRIKPGDGADRA